MSIVLPIRLPKNVHSGITPRPLPEITFINMQIPFKKKHGNTYIGLMILGMWCDEITARSNNTHSLEMEQTCQ
jgi:hypothetical protein